MNKIGHAMFGISCWSLATLDFYRQRLSNMGSRWYMYNARLTHYYLDFTLRSLILKRLRYNDKGNVCYIGKFTSSAINCDTRYYEVRLCVHIFQIQTWIHASCIGYQNETCCKNFIFSFLWISNCAEIVVLGLVHNLCFKFTELFLQDLE